MKKEVIENGDPVPLLEKGQLIAFKGFGEDIERQTFKISDIVGHTLKLELVEIV